VPAGPITSRPPDGAAPREWRTLDADRIQCSRDDQRRRRPGIWCGIGACSAHSPI